MSHNDDAAPRWAEPRALRHVPIGIVVAGIAMSIGSTFLAWISHHDVVVLGGISLVLVGSRMAVSFLDNCVSVGPGVWPVLLGGVTVIVGGWLLRPTAFDRSVESP